MLPYVHPGSETHRKPVVKCFPTIQTIKKAIQGVGGFSVSCCHQQVLVAAHKAITSAPPHPLHSAHASSPAHAWDTRPASPCKAVYSVHQAATPIFFHPLINLKKGLLTNIYSVHLSTTLHTGGSAKQPWH